jgi:predicted metalloprotease with PDZ domain
MFDQESIPIAAIAAGDRRFRGAIRRTRADALRLALLIFSFLAVASNSPARSQEGARFGVVITDLTHAESLALGYPNDGGVYVIIVREGSSAAKAGLVPKDVIVELDGRAIRDVDDFVCQLAARRPGEAARFTVVRHGQPWTVVASLGSWPRDSTRATHPPGNCGVVGPAHEPLPVSSG